MRFLSPLSGFFACDKRTNAVMEAPRVTALLPAGWTTSRAECTPMALQQPGVRAHQKAVAH